MSLVAMVSRNAFIVLVFVLFGIIALLWLAQLPEAIKTLLMYLTFIIAFFTVISYVVYHHNKDTVVKEKEQDWRGNTRLTGDDEEPTIGKTYRWAGDEE